jgi:hypothetical protein
MLAIRLRQRRLVVGVEADVAAVVDVVGAVVARGRRVRLR